jgi:hypothetical protein
MIQVTTGEIAEIWAGRVTSKCVEEGGSFPGSCVLGSVDMVDFAARRCAAQAIADKNTKENLRSRQPY